MIGWLRRRRAALAERFERGLRARAPASEPLRIDRRRVYIVPTTFGFSFGVVLVLLLLVGLNHNNNLVLLFGFLIIALILISMLMTHENLRGIELHGVHATTAHVGELTGFDLSFTAHPPTLRGSIEVEGAQPPCVDLAATFGSTVRIEKLAQRRGWLRIGTVRISTDFPFGLFYAWSYLPVREAALIYPRPERRFPSLPVASGAGGNARVRRSGDEWLGLREYRDGDPPRWIAWAAYARSGELLTREFGEFEARELWFDYDQLSGLPLEARLSRLAAWVLEAHRQALRYGLALPGQRLPPANDAAHLGACLRALALYRAEG